jgi:uncharacterized protein
VKAPIATGAEVTAVTSSAARGQQLIRLGAVAVAHRGTLIWFGQASRCPATLSFFDIRDGPHHSLGGETAMTTAEPASVVVRYVEAVRDGDIDAVRGLFAEDATWEYPGDLPLSRTWRGRDVIIGDFLGGVRTLLRPGAPMIIELTNVVSDGTQVVAEWTSRATARDGGAYHNRNIGVFAVRDGKITSVREYTDTQHVEHVLFGQR